MPIARIGSKLVYFAHVPKCAGSAVERYLEQRFGPLAFRNSSFHAVPKRRRWSKSSPQHIPLEALKRLFPMSYFATSFAIVRHPVDRLASVFLFQREIERRVDANETFESWLNDLRKYRGRSPFAFDNPIRPMGDSIPDGSRIFQLEGGLEPVVDWLDKAAENSDGPRIVAPVNVLQARLAHEKRPPVALKVDQSARDLIATLYHEDFERFGYDPSAETHY